MREIKFRYFYKNKRCLVDLQKYCNSSLNDIFYNLRKIEKIEIVQYTSLTDKNGVEIYEGDIVRFELDEDEFEIAKITFNVLNGTYQVEYINSNCIEHFSDWININHFEVIGNIFENKELLGE